jgi:hypothetical protein
MDGNVVRQSATSTTYQGATGTASPSTITTATANSYLWFDAAQQASITATYTGAQSGTTASTFYYDHNGHVTTTGSNAHINTYTTSAAGLVMVSQEALTGGGTSAPETYYFYLNDRLVGQIGNNGVTNVSYATSIQNQTTTDTLTGPFQANATTGTPSANFDETYFAVNATGNGEGESDVPICHCKSVGTPGTVGVVRCIRVGAPPRSGFKACGAAGQPQR